MAIRHTDYHKLARTCLAVQGAYEIFLRRLRADVAQLIEDQATGKEPDLARLWDSIKTQYTLPLDLHNALVQAAIVDAHYTKNSKHIETKRRRSAERRTGLPATRPLRDTRSPQERAIGEVARAPKAPPAQDKAQTAPGLEQAIAIVIALCQAAEQDYSDILIALMDANLADHTDTAIAHAIEQGKIIQTADEPARWGTAKQVSHAPDAITELDL